MSLTTCPEAAISLTLREQGGSTQEVVATCPPEVFANDRVDRGGELPRLFNYRLRSDNEIAQTIMVINTEQDSRGPHWQETDGN